MKQMYKVFLNDRVIKIGSRENITINETTVFFSDNCSKNDIRKWFAAFEPGSLNEISLVTGNPGNFLLKFQKAFIPIQAAGGVVVSTGRILFIFRNGKWDLPKGKLDKGESTSEAALREVEEETGIKPGGIDFQLPSTWHIYTPYAGSNDQWILKETAWYQMNCNGNLTGTPQQEEGITQVRWIPGNNLEEVMNNTYENLKQIISLYRENTLGLE
jgi:ADP-ribose pyrophosphatase YjhB (NUDIX family)